MPETAVLGVAWPGSGVRHGWCTGWVWYRVGIREGLYRVLPSRQGRPTPSGGMTAKRAPEAHRAGVGGHAVAPRDVRTHPSGPVGPGQALPGAPRAIAASGPIKARIEVILLKVSQNGIVSPENVEKACHSPYVQNGLEKSPLEILRFSFWPAFSHKELMVLF